MKIKSIKKIKCNNPVEMMDIIDTPNHNFLLVTNSGAIVTHNTKGANVEMEKSKIMETYSAVLARIKSRFIVDGKVRGRLFLVSSKKSEYDFIESYIKKVKGNEGVFIADARLYELKASAFSGKKFRVAVGGSNLPSKVIPDGEDNETYISQGYYIEEVPVELKQDFELDMIRALRDHCGIAVSETTRFLAYPTLERCIIPQKNPFKSNVISVGMLDQLNYRDFFEPELVPQEIYSKPLFIHFDCSLTGDRTGISCVAVLGYTNREGFDYITGEHTEIKELAYRQVFSLGIQCPNGSEISFRKNREFVYYLKHELGWNIRGISLDGFQSADSKQQFITAGFEDSTIVSLDRKPDGYLCLKSTFIERRLQFLSGQNELVSELVNLKQDNLTGKIDHDPDKCFTADTKIRLVDGRSLSIAELMIEQQYKDNYVYTFNEKTKTIEPKKIKKVFQTKLTTDLVKVTLDNGESVECTPCHRFMLRDGSYKQAIDLLEGESLMPQKEYKNYKVIKVERIHKPCRVYDLEIEDNHNFALDIGVFVHNSKDISDSLAGAVYNASLHDGQFAFHLVDNALLFTDVNEVTEDVTTDFIHGLIDNPANALANRIPKNSNKANPPISDDDRDFFNGFIIL